MVAVKSRRSGVEVEAAAVDTSPPAEHLPDVEGEVGPPVEPEEELAEVPPPPMLDTPQGRVMTFVARYQSLPEEEKEALLRVFDRDGYPLDLQVSDLVAVVAKSREAGLAWQAGVDAMVAKNKDPDYELINPFLG